MIFAAHFDSLSLFSHLTRISLPSWDLHTRPPTFSFIRNLLISDIPYRDITHVWRKLDIFFQLDPNFRENSLFYTNWWYAFITYAIIQNKFKRVTRSWFIFNSHLVAYFDRQLIFNSHLKHLNLNIINIKQLLEKKWKLFVNWIIRVFIEIRFIFKKRFRSKFITADLFIPILFISPE